MAEVHQTNILKKCCRICGATGPKQNITKMKIEQANWFGIESCQYKICNNCAVQVVLYRDKRFDEVQSKFGLKNGLISTKCTTQDACWFCFQAKEWKEVKKSAIIPGETDSQNPKKPKRDNNILKKFFQKRLDQNCTTVSLEPFSVTEKSTKKRERVQKVYRIIFHGKIRNFLWDSVCKTVYSFNGSSSTYIKKHLQSTTHQRRLANLNITESDEVIDVPLFESTPGYHNPSPDQWQQFRLIMVQGLFGTGKLAPAALNKPLLRETISKALSAINVTNDAKEVLPSRTTAVRMIQTAAYDRTMITKEEIKKAIAENPEIKFTLLHDDGTLRNGNNENLRTFSIVWIDKEGFVNKRYLKSIAAVEKDAAAIKSSILKLIDEFHIKEKFVFLTDAASTNIAVASQLNADFAVCGPHTMHNTFRNALKELAAEETAFRTFFGNIKTVLSKASRKHLNHRMLSEPGWKKMTSYVETRWCSLIDCLASLIHNWTYLEGQQIALVQSNSRQLIEEFYQMTLPFKYSIKEMESTRRTSGHLVAMELNQLLVYYINYTCDQSKPTMLQSLASHFVHQLESYMDGVQNPRKIKRICSIRLIQTAFYLPSGYLSCFNVTVESQAKQLSIDQRYNRLKKELEEWLEQHQPANSSDPERRSSFGDTELGVEIRQFSMLAAKYHDNINDASSIVQNFKSDEQNRLDANLNFWNSDYSKQILPNLRAIILPMLSISASTSLVEGTFSFSNHIRTSTRSKLDTKTLNNYLTLLYASFEN